MLRFLILTSLFLLSVTAHAQANDVQSQNEQLSTSELPSHAKVATVNAPLTSTVEQKTITTTKPTQTSSAELGFLYKSGNTQTADIKTGINFHYEDERWLSSLNIDLLIKKADKTDVDTGELHFTTTDQKWTIAAQTNYSLDNNEKHYVYANVWYEKNQFSGFSNQSSISSGWGKHWYKTNDSSLWGDIGPGYKRDQLKAIDNDPPKTSASWIIQVQALYIRKLNEHVELKQYLSAKKAIKRNENSIYKAETSIITKLISTLQLKFTFTVNYNTNIEDNEENLDTQTAITLVYNF